ASALDLDRLDQRTVGLEDALHAGAVRHLADGKGGVDATIAFGDAHALECLQTLALAFANPQVDHHRVTSREIRHFAFGLFLVDLVDDIAHDCLFPLAR